MFTEIACQAIPTRSHSIAITLRGSHEGVLIGLATTKKLSIFI